MARVDWTDEALREIDEIVFYIERFDPAAAIRVSTRLFALGDSLSEFPRRGRPVEDGLRELTTVPPYIMLYETDGEIVSIISIRHGARRPD
ncbi:MAG: type II toxin-antitoxin system RelE/ParE family toxin [Sphingomonas phyllosphaerae]|uniref:type II toxin-antitoxin system RelE/ParE family toxin n=1 Tax=Sphingomonas phyllosphaerae TaxID=257003 RepID=UPI002FFA06F3